MIKSKIKKIIEDNIKDAKINIFSSDNMHFNTIITSDIFENKTLIERQKLIYSLLENLILNEKINALSFKTYTYKEN